jgi:hypothetical protein
MERVRSCPGSVEILAQIDRAPGHNASRGAGRALGVTTSREDSPFKSPVAPADPPPTFRLVPRREQGWPAPAAGVKGPDLERRQGACRCAGRSALHQLFGDPLDVDGLALRLHNVARVCNA